MFIKAINTNKVNINGKNLAPAAPIFSLTIPCVNPYTNSTNDCHLVGINKPFSILTINRKNPPAININIVEFVIEISKLPNGCIGNILNISNCSNGLFVIMIFFMGGSSPAPPHRRWGATGPARAT